MNNPNAQNQEPEKPYTLVYCNKKCANNEDGLCQEIDGVCINDEGFCENYKEPDQQD